MEAIKTVQAELKSIVAERRVLETLTKNIPPATDRTYNFGEEVLVLSGEKKEWAGPFMVSNVEGQMITLQSKDGSYHQTFNAIEIKLFYREYKQNLHHFTSSEPSEMFIYEIIKPYDLRSKTFGASIKKKIEGLAWRKTWKLVCKSEELKDVSNLGGRFVIQNKVDGTPNAVRKSPFVVENVKTELNYLRFTASLCLDDVL